MGNLITVFKYLKSGYKDYGGRLLSVAARSRTRSSGLKLLQKKPGLEIRKNFTITHFDSG